MYRKKRITDGLIQLAIILCLLSGNISFFGFNDGLLPELVDVDLGNSLGISQFQPQYNQDIYNGGYSIKHALQYPHVMNVINAWIVDEPGPQSPASAAPPGGQNENSTPDEKKEADEDEEKKGDELTKEDMELVEILWRQDMDLGVSRDAFDMTLRKPEMKNENPFPEQLTPDIKEEKVGESVKENYVLDGETGEMIPPAGAYPVPDLLDPEDGLSEEDAMRFLEQEVAPPVGQAGASHKSLDFDRELDSILEHTANFPLPVNASAPYFTPLPQPQAQHLLPPLLLSNNSNINSSGGFLQDFPAVASNNSLLSLLNSTSLGQPQQQLPGDGYFPFQTFFNGTPATGISDALIRNTSFHLPVNNSMNSSNNSFSNITDSMAMGSMKEPASFFDTRTNSSEDLIKELLGGHSLENISLSEVRGLEDMNITELSDSAISSPANGNETFPNNASSFPTFTPEAKFHPVATETQNFPAPASEDLGYHSPLHSSFTSGRTSSLSSNSSNEDDFKMAAAGEEMVKHNHTYGLSPSQMPRPKREKKPPIKAYASVKDTVRAKLHKLPFSTEEITNTPVETFNELLQTTPLSERQLALVRDIRRRGKNKVAAQNCRKRKLDVINNLDQDVQQMRNDRERLIAERSRLEREVLATKQQFRSLYQEVFDSLRDEQGRPYDPRQFTLEQGADGNVFLMQKSAQREQQGFRRKRMQDS